MRHHSDDIAFPTADPCDIAETPVWICSRRRIAADINITEYNLVVSFESVKRLFISNIRPFAVCNRQTQFASGLQRRRTWRFTRLDSYPDELADKVQRLISNEC